MADLIRLNDKGIRAYMSRGGSTHGSRLQWADRVGRIVKYNRDRSIAYVVWDGTHTFDRVSVELIEPAVDWRGRNRNEFSGTQRSVAHTIQSELAGVGNDRHAPQEAQFEKFQAASVEQFLGSAVEPNSSHSSGLRLLLRELNV